MKIKIYELLGLIKDGKASDITTKFMFDRNEYNLISFLGEYTLDINSLNWEIEILYEKIIPEKIDKDEIEITMSSGEQICANKINEIIDYLVYIKSKGE